MTIEMCVYLLTALVFVIAFTSTVVVIGARNKRTAEHLVKVTEQVKAATLLRHAIDHLATLGIGENLEYSSARQICELAMIRVMQ